MSISFSFYFDHAEHYRADRAILSTTPMKWIMRGAGTFACIGFVWSVLQPSDVETWFPAWLSWLVLGAMVLLFPVFRRRSLRQVAQRDPSLQGIQERRLDAVGYHSSGNKVTFDVPWHAILRCVETREFLLLFYFKNWAYYIPKRALSEDQLAVARGVIREGLGDKAKLLGM